MNRSIIKQLVVAAVIGGCGALPTVTVAEETEAPVTIPDTSAGIWQAVDGQMQELRAAIAQGKLNTVHQNAFAVRDLVRSLPSHSATLPAEALAKVTAQTKFVDTLAERLDQTGDANDKAGTETNVSKLEGVLKTIRDQYASSK
jgi:hypothetical protein